MDAIVNSKVISEDMLKVEYEVVPLLETKDEIDICRKQIEVGIKDVEANYSLLESKLSELNSEIERLTNHADGIDCTIAVACGILAGAIDVMFVGEFDFEGSYEEVEEKFKDIVTKKAQKIEDEEKQIKITDAIADAKKKANEKGKELDDDKISEIKKKIEESYKKKHDVEGKIKKELEKIQNEGGIVDEEIKEKITKKIQDREFANRIKKLEEAYNIPSDGVFNEVGNGIDAKSHHLDDLAHHPSPIGWMASMMTQFTKNTYFQNKDGDILKIKAQTVKKIVKGKEKIEIELIGGDLKAKFVAGTFNWVGHLISDIAGSCSSAAKGNMGMGLPGPIMSMFKEIAMLPLVRNTSLPKILHELFTKDNAIFNEYRLDMRSELAIGLQLGKQAIPVLINEVLVRTCYFVRRLIPEIKNAKSIHDIKLKNASPFKNRTIVRMLTISYGTQETIDLADAAIRATASSGGTLPGFVGQFVLRVNFVGVGRFAIAIVTDAGMGIKRNIRIRERNSIYGEQRILLGAKMQFKVADVWCDIADSYKKSEQMYKKQADVWKETQETQKSMEELQDEILKAVNLYKDSISMGYEQMSQIVEILPEAEKLNPGITQILLGGR